MPLVTQPDLIEQSDFSAGWSPDSAADSTDSAASSKFATHPDQLALPDVLNLLVDPITGSMELRNGFVRLGAAFGGMDFGHVVRQVQHFNPAGEQNLIICVLTDYSGSADNVQLWAYDASDDSFTRFDDAGVTWDHPEAEFWMVNVDGTLYGGSKGNRMWSYDGTTYDGNCSIGTNKQWTNHTGGAVDTANEFGSDYAWNGKEKCWLGSDTHIYTPDVKIRYPDWNDGDHYLPGDRVSRKSDGYWKSYRCTDKHVADAGTNRPDDTASWDDVWKRVQLPKPKDEDDETSDKWVRVPLAAQTSIGVWFADRLFLRFDGQGDNSRMQYSAPVKAEKGEDIPDTTFDPKDFTPGNDFRGEGGGWLPFNDGRWGGPITAAHNFGQYLIVFKRRSTWVLSGNDDTSWTTRKIGRGVGAVSQQSVVELDGVVYFLCDDGLYMTDGTQVTAVDNNDRIRFTLRARLDSLMLNLGVGTQNQVPTLFRVNGMVGITLPDNSDVDSPAETWFYEPITTSFWKTDLPILDACTFHNLGIERLAFCRSQDIADSSLAILYEYAGTVDDGGEADDAITTPDIPWLARSSWYVMGTQREERRVRRVEWAVDTAGADATVKGYRNFDSASEGFTKTHTAPGSVTWYAEGLWMPDAYAVQLRVSGSAHAAVTVYGTAVHTQRRRAWRYHN